MGLSLEDQQKFNRIIHNNSDKIYGLFMKITGNHDQADELTQRTFIKVHEKFDSFRGNSAISTWIYRIAINVGKNYLRKEKAKNFISLDNIFNLPDDDSPDSNIDFKGKLQKAISKLPTKQHMVVLLRAFQDLPYKQIGAILGISENAAKANYSHALNNLKKHLLKMGVKYGSL